MFRYAHFVFIFAAYILAFDIILCRVGKKNAVSIAKERLLSSKTNTHYLYLWKSNKSSNENARNMYSNKLRLRGGSKEPSDDENFMVSNLERLSLDKNTGPKRPKAEVRKDHVIEMAKSLKATLKSLNKGLVDEDSSHDSAPTGDDISDNFTTDEISKMLTTRTEYDDIFADEGSSKFRDQVLDVMKQFDLQLEDDPNDLEVQKMQETDTLLEEAEQFAKTQEHKVEELKWILERPQRLRVGSDLTNTVLLVGDSRPDSENITFETVSDAVNSSFRGQMVRILAGRHFVGNALCCLGLKNSSIPMEWPNTIHLTAGWSVNISGESDSEADGRFFFMRGSHAQFRTVRISNRCSAKDSLFLGSNHLLDAGAMEPRITGIVLLEVWGAIDMEQCNATINGGVCAAFVGSASGRFMSCQIGGFGPETEVGRETLDVPGVQRRLSRLLSDSEPRAAQGLTVRNSSSITLHGCKLCHIWNGGVSVHQAASARLDGSTLHDVGYGVGMDDAASVVVTACRIETSDDAILESAAFYAMSNSSAVKLRSEHNLVSGREWIGRRRPGHVEPAPAASAWVDEVGGIGASASGRPARRAAARRRGNIESQDESSEEGEWDEDEAARMAAELRMLQELLTQAGPAFPRFDLG
jgi:hypothetical protein